MDLTTSIYIQTKYGEILLQAQGKRGPQGTHVVWVDLHPKGESLYFSIRGVEYSGSGHLYQWADGRFHVGPEAIDYDAYGKPTGEVRTPPDWERRRALRLNRRFDGTNKVTSDAAVTAAIAELERVVN